VVHVEQLSFQYKYGGLAMSLLNNRFLLFVIILSAVMCTAFPSFGADFYVTKTEDTNDESCDENDCSLREAIIAANDSSSDLNTIYVPAGKYLITIPNNNEEGPATGDFDITNSMTIIGEGMDATIINALGLFGVHDHVFHVDAPNQIIGFEDLGIYGGYALGIGLESAAGGGVFITDAREVYFYRCHLYRNEAVYGGAIFFGDDDGNALNNTLTITESVVERECP
jgi:CSLREA domain-containing protein